jgi:hypothetical protein
MNRVTRSLETTNAMCLGIASTESPEAQAEAQAQRLNCHPVCASTFPESPLLLPGHPAL